MCVRHMLRVACEVGAAGATKAVERPSMLWFIILLTIMLIIIMIIIMIIIIVVMRMLLLLLLLLLTIIITIIIIIGRPAAAAEAARAMEVLEGAIVACAEQNNEIGPPRPQPEPQIASLETCKTS